MNREIVHGLAALACLATSVLALPARAQAIQEYMYEPDRIYTVRTGLGITTQIELSPNEKIIDYSRSEEHTSELQSLMRNSYAVFCLNKKKKLQQKKTI